MRTLPVAIFFLSLMSVPTVAQADKGGDEDTAASELEHLRLRDLLASQSAELAATREQLRRLEQRMELLETQLGAQSNLSATKDMAVAAIAPETRTAGPNAEAPPLATERKLAQGGNNENASAMNHEGKSDSIELANGRVRIGTLLYADYAYYLKTGFGPQFTSQINPPGRATMATTLSRSRGLISTCSILPTTPSHSV